MEDGAWGLRVRDYGGVVLIAVLLFTETTITKLAAHGITPEEARQVNDSDRIVIANPRPRSSDDRPHPRWSHPDGRSEPRTQRRRRLGRTHGLGFQRRADQSLSTRPMNEHHVAVPDDDEITSDELDAVLDEAKTIKASRPENGTEVRLYVAVDVDTLHELERRAAAQGTDLNSMAAEALRAGARAA
jgi:hypothetical protein